MRELEHECAELRRQLAVAYTSKSWRLTAPLRRAAAFLRGRHGARVALAPASADASAPAEETGFPPAPLRERVAGTPDLEWFKLSGEMAVADISDALGVLGRTLSEFTRVYDFGCGCGRIAIPLAATVGEDRITATDTDGEATAWLTARLPRARVERGPTLPPLAYPDDAFDLIIGWSVLTHLPEDYQDAWLAELARVLAPDGVMLQTVHGPTHFDRVGSAADDPVRNALPSAGFIYYENHGPDSPFAAYYQTSYHHPDYIRRHWSQWLRVVDVRPGCARPSQDMVVLLPRQA